MVSFPFAKNPSPTLSVKDWPDNDEALLELRSLDGKGEATRELLVFE